LFEERSVAKTHKPTAEKKAVVEAAQCGGDLKVKAYAGVGKTSTLRLVAQQFVGKRGSYLAFNKEIADSARRSFPSNVVARTIHSLANTGAPTWLTARVELPSEPRTNSPLDMALALLKWRLSMGKMWRSRRSGSDE
jgi:hypothetical protein